MEREYNIKFGEYPVRIDEVNSMLIYLGYALNLGVDPSSENWKIKKIEKIGSVWEIKWADGDEMYDNIWNNRATLNYK